MPKLMDDVCLLKSIENTVKQVHEVLITGTLRKGQDDTVDFCNGTPGAIPMLTLACELFP
jgi:hypothetical protein